MHIGYGLKLNAFLNILDSKEKNYGYLPTIAYRTYSIVYVKVSIAINNVKTVQNCDWMYNTITINNVPTYLPSLLFSFTSFNLQNVKYNFII